MSWKRSRFTAAGIAAACGLTMLAGVSLLAAPAVPTLHIEGLRLQNVPDPANPGASSIQALVDVYVSDVPRLTGGALRLGYTGDYWEPSRIADNSLYTDHATESTFFSTNPDLYGGAADPFLFENERVKSEVDVTGSALVLGFNLKSALELTDQPGDKIEIHEWDQGTGEVTPFTYIDAEEKLLLGTLSFRVNPAGLEAMTGDTPLDTLLDKSALSAAWENAIMFPRKAESGAGASGNAALNGWTLGFLDVAGDGEAKSINYDGDRMIDGNNSPASNLHLKYEIPDVIVGVEAAQKEVVINAYQAYTDATPGDLAAALQRYSSAVRLTYPNGDMRDEAMFWGDDVMTVKDNNTGRLYQFRYTSGGYTFQEVDAGGNVLNANADGDYDPTGGDYTVTQFYHYVENDENGDPVNKTYPSPVTVHLTVIPVKVIGFTAEDLQKSYKIDDPNLPDDCEKLELPREGRLVFDTVLSGTIPAMPLTTWTNGTNTLPVTNMSLLTGLHGSTQVNWPVTPADIAGNVGVGTYGFTCADPTQGAIRAAHPWATVTTGYTVEALRAIKPDSAVKREYVATAEVDGPTGIQTITVRSADGSQMLSSTFTIYRPDGVKVDPAWFVGSGSGILSPGGAHITSPVDVGYQIQTYPGDTTTGNWPVNAADRETTRRHINLGGYFTVVVNEGVYGMSDPIKVYQPRRQNAYLYNYNSGATTVDKPEFDFTGHKAGLYPFHSYSTLPDTVVLPLDCGYIVHTRYDGVTGGEPGQVRSFAVDQWTAVSPAPAAAVPYWPANSVVTYGEDLFSDHSYGSGFGLVENPDKRKVKMLVETDEQTDPPVESLLLTYEGAPAPSNILELADGQVGTVVFDTVQEGYAYKQEFELTLTNNGTTDIHGIYVDAMLGAVEDPNPDGEQHFEIIKPPATDLAPGGSTTFIISYVLGLEKNTYVDDIYVGTASGLTKTFIARFKVVDGKLYKLTVQPFPEDGAMGNGGAVTGIVAGVYDATPVGGSLQEHDPVWICVKPKDGYELKKDPVTGNYQVYYMDENANKVYLTPYVPAGTADAPGEGEMLFSLPGDMPARDTVVYVEFFEPILSKLRLSDLEAYADENYTDNPPNVGNPFFTPPYQQIMYDLTDPTYQTTGFDQDHFDYLVVIPVEDDHSGLKLTLYDITVPYEVIGAPYSSETPVLNQVITPDVIVKLDDPGQTEIINERGTVGSTSATPPDPNPSPSVFQRGFESPDPGKRRTATITISYYDGIERYEREYKVTFVRQTEVPEHTFAYGNTPYGMIMNAANIADADKAAAKEAYDKQNRFTDTYTPTKAFGLREYIYWPQAWEREYPDWPSNWGERNLDRNDHALVAYAGEAFDDPGVKEILDSTGAKIEDQTLKRSVEVALLDPNGTTAQYTTPGTTAGRFNGTRTAVIQLSDLVMNGDTAPLDRLTELVDWEAVEGETIRPGIYALKYTFTDFDGAQRSFTRPLVILNHLGDVDASGGPAVELDYDAGDGGDGSDVNALHQRIAEPWRLGDITDVVNYPDYDKAVYRYRICDVNDDSHINYIDANRIQNEAALTDFYRPVDYIG